ncbi:hypothetical protein AMS69_03125 [Haloarcula rubripromontorii]|uniref:YokE-like PH domain-containing protein n=1 Tax=Haloarcula rubripromontorii TaxID=1705562 RepID=A0A0M9AM69_9EURY|nr:PH domain-containing protein [Haloarcula rubripromontorii]KOX94867.1 hypothetical protein AMS69_03125 [Haloarcula rubripromontorii]
MPEGNYVTNKTVSKVEDELRADEEVQYLARGNKVEQSYRGSTEKLGYLRGRPWLVVTDQRVFLKIPKAMSSHVDSFEYDELAGADLGNSGMTGTRVKFRTVQGKDYSFRADKPEDTELEMMVEFMREQASGQRSTGAAPSGSHSADLHQTESCIECGQGVSEGVSRCPNCGFNPAAHNKWRAIHSVLAGFSFITIVGIPLAIWFYLKAKSHRKKVKGGVTG